VDHDQIFWYSRSFLESLAKWKRERHFLLTQSDCIVLYQHVIVVVGCCAVECMF